MSVSVCSPSPLPHLLQPAREDLSFIAWSLSWSVANNTVFVHTALPCLRMGILINIYTVIGFFPPSSSPSGLATCWGQLHIYLLRGLKYKTTETLPKTAAFQPPIEVDLFAKTIPLLLPECCSFVTHSGGSLSP